MERLRCEWEGTFPGGLCQEDGSDLERLGIEVEEASIAERMSKGKEARKTKRRHLRKIRDARGILVIPKHLIRMGMKLM